MTKPTERSSKPRGYALFKDHAGTSAVPVELITDNATVRLLTAFAEITDRAIRRRLSELVERVANNAK